MSAHSLRYPRRASAEKTLRIALQRGHLTQAGRHWLFRARRFHASTVNNLIDRGEAVRVGDHVIAWRPA